MNTTNSNQHIPVLLERVLDVLQPTEGESYLDLTSGYGGHARAIIEKTGKPEAATLVDQDSQALEATHDLQDLGATPIHLDFASAVVELGNSNQQFDMILADLGVSSPHLDDAERGFSFMREGPLDMRMNRNGEGPTAADIVNTAARTRLETILRELGEEKQAKRIAEAIIAARPLQTTHELASVVENVIPRRGKTHPATRTFQAIRMAVNNELEQVERMLAHIEELMKPGSRLAIISFHSLEDRLVKTFFNERCKSGYESTMELLTKRPILGTEESDTNPRSRSAVLRAVVKK